MVRSNIVSFDRDKSYRWVYRDPDLEFIANAITKSGLSSEEISQTVSRTSKSSASISPKTIDKWLNGSTKRPQNWTLTWVAHALGYDRRWIAHKQR